MIQAKAHDGSSIEVEVRGSGPVLLLPIDPQPVEGEQADEIGKWGGDPELGRTMIDGLSDVFRVAAFDYTGHVLKAPKPDTLTPGNVSADLLAVADAVGAERFAYYGYSWLALSGLQLALRTDRLSALVMGGYPPYAGPYAEMLKVTMAAYEMSAAPKPVDKKSSDDAYDWASVEVSTTVEQSKQFVTLYEALQDFDDRTVRLSCPRLCFAGSRDQMSYEERWGGVVVDIAGPLVRHQAELEALGWDVEVLDGLDHMGAMHSANALPLLRSWLTRTLLA